MFFYYYYYIWFFKNVFIYYCCCYILHGRFCWTKYLNDLEKLTVVLLIVCCCTSHCNFRQWQKRQQGIWPTNKVLIRWLEWGQRRVKVPINTNTSWKPPRKILPGLAFLHWLPIKFRMEFNDQPATHLKDLIITHHPTRALHSHYSGLPVVPRITRTKMGGRPFSFQGRLL